MNNNNNNNNDNNNNDNNNDQKDTFIQRKDQFFLDFYYKAMKKFKKKDYQISINDKEKTYQFQVSIDSKETTIDEIIGSDYMRSFQDFLYNCTKPIKIYLDEYSITNFNMDILFSTKFFKELNCYQVLEKIKETPKIEQEIENIEIVLKVYGSMRKKKKNNNNKNKRQKKKNNNKNNKKNNLLNNNY